MCVAAPGGGAVTYTQPSVLSNPDFSRCKNIFCDSLNLVGEKDSANSTGTDLQEIASQNLQQVEMSLEYQHEVREYIHWSHKRGR